MALTRLEIVRREPFEEGRAFGETGPYERIDAVAHYAVDPAHPANAGIVDLDRAERAPDGKVRFSGDATFLVPVDPARANRALLLDVPNRGNRIAMRSFDMAPFDLMPTDEITPGDGFLLERGWSIAWCGWQWDVPHPSVRLGLRAPVVPRANRTPAGRMQPAISKPVPTWSPPPRSGAISSRARSTARASCRSRRRACSGAAAGTV